MSFLDNVIDLVRQAGRAVMYYYQSTDLTVEHKGSGLNDVFTAADMASHTILMQGLTKLWATQILSEESVDKVFDRSWTVWIIDPIDGTRLFISWWDGFCILVARCTHGVVDLGIAYFPALHEMFFAEQWWGCWLDTEGQVRRLITTQYQGALDPAMLRYKVQLRSERSPDEEDMRLLYDFVQTYGWETTTVFFGYDTRNILLGELDCFVETYPRLGKRDLAAPSLLLKEAWYGVTDLHGHAIDFLQPTPTYRTPTIVCTDAMWAYLKTLIG